MSASDKTLEQVKASLRERLAGAKAPFHVTDREAAAEVIERLASLDGEHWGSAWADAGEKVAARARAAEQAGRVQEASTLYHAAYGLFYAGRYPVPSHPRKQHCYERARECYLAAGRHFSPPIECVRVPFDGRDGEGREVVFYARRQARAGRQPVVVRWSGIDTWKEERQDIDNAMHASGFATITIDMPGTGESPVLASLDAERQYLPVLDWIAAQPDLDAARVAIVGMSYGGYWATKLAHLHPDRIRAAVSWGGPAHHNFKREWVLGSAAADSYLMELGIARARSVGVPTYEEYADRVAGFSLLEQGLLDRRHAPMLLVNGKADRQVPTRTAPSTIRPHRPCSLC